MIFAEPELVLEQARRIVGAEGKVSFDAPRNRLFVTATDEQHRQIDDFIKQVSVPPKNIQIQVRTNADTANGAGIRDLRGNARVTGNGGIRGNVSGRVFARGNSFDSTQNAAQFITVTSGRQAWINVSEDVPFAPWFLDYGVRSGYLQPSIAWRQVGARLVVEPRVVGAGNMILVRFIPEFTYFVDNKNFTTQFINVATELTVASGQEFRVGGSAQSAEFMNKFLIGYDRSRRQRAVDIVLKATVLP